MVTGNTVFKKRLKVQRTRPVCLPQVRGARRGARGAAERAASGARAAPPREAAGRSSLHGRLRRAGGVLVGQVCCTGRVRQSRVRRDRISYDFVAIRLGLLVSVLVCLAHS